MVCPVMSSRTSDPDGYSVEVECKRARCAWWDELGRGCGTFTRLGVIEVVLTRLGDRLINAGLSRKDEGK